MRVNNQNPNQSAQNVESTSSKGVEKSARAQKNQKSERTSEAKDQKSVNTDISDRAKEMANAKELATHAADVREEKIAELKRRIANKEYNVKPEAIADKMVDEHLQTSSLG